jgi:hypothetical protein
MKLYHVAVHREDQWYIGRVLERSGVTTQGRTSMSWFRCSEMPSRRYGQKRTYSSSWCSRRMPSRRPVPAPVVGGLRPDDAPARPAHRPKKFG